MKESEFMKRRTTIPFVFVVVFALCLVLAACDNDYNAQGKLTSGDVVAEGAFADGITLRASKLEATDSDYTAAIDKIADKEYDKGKVAVFDISLEKDNAKVQPSGKVKITMPAPFDTENGYVTYHISGETVEELDTFLADGKITFETAGFSCFVVAGTTGGSVIGPGGNLNPNDPSKNFFAYVDTYDQATMTANGTVVPKGGYSATMKERDMVELVATAKDGYRMLGWYKNSKQSGSDERYEEMSNPATFTYTGTEKMYVYARFDVIEYEIKVNLNGGAFKEGEGIPATYTVESDTITLPTPEGVTEFLGWKNADGEIVSEIAKGSTGDITLTATWKASTYVRVDKDKNPDENGEYILFGSYPQKRVEQSGHQSALETALSEKAGDLPENGNNGNWTSFKYYYTVKGTDGTLSMSNDIDFMWYIDVEHNGEKYRGVYFTHFRPAFALDGSFGVLDRENITTTLQYKNKYYGRTVYWFKYEPILWRIIGTDGDKVKLLSMSILDSQAYCTAAEKNTEEIIYTNEKKDEWYYPYYNITPDVPKGTVATNYKYSNIRSWLNGDFYGVAFDEKQKALVNDTTLDNKSVGLGESTTDKVFLITLDEARSLGSKNDALRKATDYATGLGADVNPYYDSRCMWYLRESFNGKMTLESARYGWVCSVDRDGNLLDDTKTNQGAFVMSTIVGVVPSLWITL